MMGGAVVEVVPVVGCRVVTIGVVPCSVVGMMDVWFGVVLLVVAVIVLFEVEPPPVTILSKQLNTINPRWFYQIIQLSSPMLAHNLPFKAA